MPTPIVPTTTSDGKTFRDFDGSNGTDLVITAKGRVKVLLSDGDGSFNKGSYENLTTTALAVGSGNPTSRSGTKLILVSQEKTKGKTLGSLRWDSVDAITGATILMTHFGAKADKPVMGCHRNGVLVPTVIAKVGTHAYLEMLIGGRITKRSLSSPTTSVMCSFEKTGTSRVFYLTTTRTGYTAQASDLSGAHLIKSAVLTKTGERVVLLAAGSFKQTQLAMLKAVGANVELSVFDELSKKWAVQTMSVDATKGIVDVSSGTTADQTRWLAITLKDGSQTLLQLNIVNAVTKVIENDVDVSL